MMDLSDKGSECEGTSGVTTPTPDSDYSNLKTCVDCGTSRTPLWRGGPAGPKSLCNACGIRSRKKRRALMGEGVAKEDKKSTKKSTAKNTSDSCTSSSGDSTVKIRDPLNKKMWAHLALQRPRSSATRRRKVGREEEQAAFLLMALSCGSVYA